MKLQIQTAEVFEPLLEPARYKAVHGGRGSGKSHFFAGLMVEDALAEPGNGGNEGLRAVCIREIQKDLSQSSKALLEAKLSSLGLGQAQGFKVYKDVISLPGDGLCIFKGMNDYTADSVKSLEGFKRAWWEEAQTASQRSLDLLRPTMRAPGSELWFGWNPRRKIDPIDKLFRGEHMPSRSKVVQANWSHNPWFPDELEQERQDCLLMQPDQYDHIWEGGYASVIEGAYFAKQLAECKAQGRIGAVAADPLLTLRAHIDIGGTGAKSDAFVIWITQFCGPQIRVVDHYEAVGQPMEAHVNWLRSKGYTHERVTIVLPHDGVQNDKVHRVSYEGAFRQLGYKTVVIPNMGAGAAMKRIETARRVFPNVYFNADTTEAGRDAIGFYHEKRDDKRNIGLGPDHDWASHSADAFGLMAVDYELHGTPVSMAPIPYKRLTR